MAQEKCTQGEKDMALRVFKIIEIYKGSMTPEEISQEKSHFENMEVFEATKTQLEKVDIASKAAQMRELKKTSVEVEQSLANIETAINSLPAAFESLGNKLAVLGK